ncbi:hypothetical protein FPV67DRAFT_1355723, partial [Lyophyllum atratum]
MIGCKFLYEMSRALSTATGSATIFGGINVIFAGDFAQLPPVGEVRLYAKIKTHGTSAASQDVVMGKLLWLSVRTVVCLDEQHRQAGDDNLVFVNVLQRMREGRCNDADVRLNAEGWLDAPVIVYGNAAKDAINELAAKQFARETGQELHWYYAID